MVTLEEFIAQIVMVAAYCVAQAHYGHFCQDFFLGKDAHDQLYNHYVRPTHAIRRVPNQPPIAPVIIEQLDAELHIGHPERWT
jgi:hypothetical protein